MFTSEFDLGKARVKKGLSVAQLAAKSRISGETIRNIENGSRPFSATRVNTLFKLCHALGLDVQISFVPKGAE